VAYSLKARIVETKQPAVTRQRPVNKNRRMVFPVQPVPTAADATMEYVMPSLSNRGTVISMRSVPRCYKQDKSVSEVGETAGDSWRDTSAWRRVRIPPPYPCES
jgi:hypothetical protein